MIEICEKCRGEREREGEGEDDSQVQAEAPRGDTYRTTNVSATSAHAQPTTAQQQQQPQQQLQQQLQQQP